MKPTLLIVALAVATLAGCSRNPPAPDAAGSVRNVGDAGERRETRRDETGEPSLAQPREPVTSPAAPPVSGYDTSVQPPTGRACKVHLRRDAMGLSAPAPFDAARAEVPGRATHLAGTIDRVAGDWLVLRGDGKEWWIPREMVLAIELDPQR